MSAKVVAMVRQARRVRAKTAAGTDLTAELNPNYRWLKTSGIITAEKWGNLPGGEIFTTPGEVNGTFVIDGVVGDYLCAKFGNLRQHPLTVHIKNNRLTEAHSENHELEDDFWKYTHTDENSDRVGEFAIGTNIDLKDVIGQILQDEKYPGVHIAFGNPYGAHTLSLIHILKPSFSIGIEEEYQTVDPQTRDLRSHIQAEILEKGRLILQERVKAEMHQSVVEVGTGVCKNIKEARCV